MFISLYFIDIFIIFFTLITYFTVFFNILYSKKDWNYFIKERFIILIILLIFYILIITSNFFLYNIELYTIILNINKIEQFLYRFTFLWTNSDNLYFLWFFLSFFLIYYKYQNNLYKQITTKIKLNQISFLYIPIFILYYFIYQNKSTVIKNTFYIYNGFHIHPNLQDQLLLVHPPLIVSFYILIIVFLIFFIIN